MSLEASKHDIKKRQEESMIPPTESELDKLQSRIDMREAAAASLRWVHPGCDAALLAKHVLKLLDEIEELETTIATQACDIAEYKRERLSTGHK